MLDQKFCLLFASTAMQSEVHVELDWVYAREPVSELSGTVGRRLQCPYCRIQEASSTSTFAPFPTASSLRSFLKVPWWHINVRSGDILSHIALAGFQSARKRESAADTFALASVTKRLRELSR